MYQVKVDPLYFKKSPQLLSPWYNRTGWLGVKHQLTYLPQLLPTNLHHLVMMLSQKYYIKSCDRNHMTPEKENLQFYIFKHIELGDSLMKIHTKNGNLHIEHLVYMTLFASGYVIFKAAWETPEISHSLEHQKCHGWEYHQADEECSVDDPISQLRK